MRTQIEIRLGKERTEYARYGAVYTNESIYETKWRIICVRLVLMIDVYSTQLKWEKKNDVYCRFNDKWCLHSPRKWLNKMKIIFERFIFVSKCRKNRESNELIYVFELIEMNILFAFNHSLFQSKRWKIRKLFFNQLYFSRVILTSVLNKIYNNN